MELQDIFITVWSKNCHMIFKSIVERTRWNNKYKVKHPIYIYITHVSFSSINILISIYILYLYTLLYQELHWRVDTTSSSNIIRSNTSRNSKEPPLVEPIALVELITTTQHYSFSDHEREIVNFHMNQNDIELLMKEINTIESTINKYC